MTALAGWRAILGRGEHRIDAIARIPCAEYASCHLRDFSSIPEAPVPLPRTTFALILAFAVLASLAIGQSTPGPRRNEPAANPAIQQELMNGHAGYAAFLKRAGGHWIARFDEDGGNPAFIVGSGIEVSKSRIETIAEARTHAEATIRKFPELWGAPIADLHLTNEVKAGPLYIFTWQQRWDGLDVVDGRVQIQIHEAGRVCALSTTAVAIPPGFSRTPRLDGDDAAGVVRNGKTIRPADAVEAVDFVVFIKRNRGASEPRLAYAVEVSQPSITNHELAYVDADTAEVLEVRPLVVRFDVKGKVQANVNTGLLPGDPLHLVPLESARASVLHIGLPPEFTDENGDYYFSTALTGPFTVDVDLLSTPYFNILNGSGPNISGESITVSNGGFDEADVRLNPATLPPTQFTTAQVNAAWHHDAIRKYVEGWLPSFVPFSSQTIEVNSQQPYLNGGQYYTACGALYTFGTHVMRFYSAGTAGSATCVNTAYSTVIYHEYGHAVDDYYQGETSEALSEALGDILAMFKTGQPVVGADFSDQAPFYIRTGTNSTTWPVNSNDPHTIGETYMGFAWKVWGKIGGSLAQPLFMNVFPANNLGILDAVTQAFLLDDDDGNIWNSTPHYTELAEAAAEKGFPAFLTTELVSVSSAGVQGNSSSYGTPSISADGRYVAFYSPASNLVSGDTNGSVDIFVRDRQTGTTELVSVSSSGVQGNGSSYSPSISADGRYVAFYSLASNLVTADTNLYEDVFVRDRQAGTTERVSVSSAGAQGNSSSYTPSISADGRYVAFRSYATNLVSGNVNGYSDIFVRDRQTGTTTRVSVANAGYEGNNDSSSPSISADGRYVAFASLASNLVSGAGDTNGVEDIFVRDRQTGTTERVSVSSAGTQGNGASSSPSISADGRYVAFYSLASNLVSGDTNGTFDIFVRDRQTGTTELVSVSSSGVQGNSASSSPSISADGRYVAFYSPASNLVSGDTNGSADIFVRAELGPTPDPWSSLGGGLGGQWGIPFLSASGVPTGGSPISLTIERASPNSLVFYIIGGSQANIPLFGGILVPYPDLSFSTTTDANGNGSSVWIWPTGYPSGITAWFQAVVLDITAPYGMSFSNTLQCTQL
jgi:Tol biopolymer transport system component